MNLEELINGYIEQRVEEVLKTKLSAVVQRLSLLEAYPVSFTEVEIKEIFEEAIGERFAFLNDKDVVGNLVENYLSCHTYNLTRNN